MCKEDRSIKTSKTIKDIVALAHHQRVDKGKNCGWGEWINRVTNFRREVKKLIKGNHCDNITDQLPYEIADLLT